MEVRVSFYSLLNTALLISALGAAIDKGPDPQHAMLLEGLAPII
ncbi:MAG: hypothetical protein ACQEV7_09670 [Bacillota bacterium]